MGCEPPHVMSSHFRTLLHVPYCSFVSVSQKPVCGCDVWYMHGSVQAEAGAGTGAEQKQNHADAWALDIFLYCSLVFETEPH